MNLFSKDRQRQEMEKLQKINAEFQAKEGFTMTGLHLTEHFKGFLNDEYEIPGIDEGIRDYVYVNENVYGVGLDEDYVIVYRVKELDDLYTAYGKKVYFETDFVKMIDLEEEMDEIKENMDEDLNNLRNWIYLQSTVLGGVMMENEDIETEYFGNLFRTFMTIATEETFIPDVKTINNLLLDIRENLNENRKVIVDKLFNDLQKLNQN